MIVNLKSLSLAGPAISAAPPHGWRPNRRCTAVPVVLPRWTWRWRLTAS